MHVFTDSKVALRDAVTRPSKRLSSWELLDLAEQDRTLKAELARQQAKVQKQQQEISATKRHCLYIGRLGQSSSQVRRR